MSLKITFKKFGWLRDQSFELPNEGMILLHGKNGTGKTTLMRGIAFVLFGNMRDVVTTGEKNCSVNLEFEGLNITRYVPSRLVVTKEGETYEADAAQSIINARFSIDYERFSTACCISQHSLNNSVISMSPNAQLQFVENIVSLGVNHSKNKKDIKKYVSDKSQTLQSCKQKQALASCELATLSKTLVLDKITLPEETLPTLHGQRETVTDELALEKQNIASLRKKYNNIHNSLSLKTERNKKIASLEAEIKLIQNSTNKISSQEIQDFQNALKIVSTNLSHLKNMSKRDRLQTAARELKKKFLDAMGNEINKLRENVLDEEDEIKMKEEFERLSIIRTAYETYKNECVVYEASKKQYDALLSEIITLFAFPKTYGVSAIKKALISSLAVGKVGTCPSCNAKLSTCDDGNFILHSSPKKKVKKLDVPSVQIQTYLNKLDGCIVQPKPSAVEFDVDAFELLKSKLKASEEAKPRLEEIMKSKSKIVYPPDVISAYKELRNVEKLIPKDFSIQDDEKQLREKESQITMELGGLMKASALADAQEKERIKKVKELALLKAKVPKEQDDDEFPKLLELMSTSELKIATLQGSLDDINQNISKYTLHETYTKNLSLLEEAKKSFEASIEKVSQAQEEYTAALLLERRYKEYEFSALENAVNRINEAAKPHIDRLFDDPIVVKLCASKTNLNGETKMQMSTFIDYRCTNIKNLSGGERQKCELAYVLAVNELLGGRFVFFDECAAHIDEGMQKEILDYVRMWIDASDQIGIKKLVLFVEHKTIMGKFDEVIGL